MGFICFFKEDYEYSLKNESRVIEWIITVIQKEEKLLENINYIFCSDDYLLKINRQYLKHDSFTDIITFDHSDSHEIIDGDIFISVERVKENSKMFNKTLQNELCRVIIHGVLHLIGYVDKTTEDQQKMRELEDKYLNEL